MASALTPGILKLILASTLRVAGSMTLTVPPISELTQTCVPSAVNSATRGRLSTRTLSMILFDAVSMKCAMLVVSDVATKSLPSGLIPRPSGSTPTGISATTVPFSASPALRLLVDRDLRHPGVLFDVHGGHEVVVLVGDVERVAGWMQDEELGVLPGPQGFHELHGLGVVDLHIVVVAGADQQPFVVLRQGHAARALTDLDRLDDLELGAVDDADRVVLLVRDVDGIGARSRREQQPGREQQG